MRSGDLGSEKKVELKLIQIVLKMDHSPNNWKSQVQQNMDGLYRNPE